MEDQINGFSMLPLLGAASAGFCSSAITKTLSLND
jgi:hypothetical protein